MSDIFISYASEDRAYAKQLAESLVHHGWTIWWDRKIPFGKSFDQIIEEQINEARCLIVLWSAHSVASDWVKNEAREGKERGILIPVLIEQAKIPLEFRHVQTANLVGWEPALPHSEFDELLRELKQLLARQPQQEYEQDIPSLSSEGESKSGETFPGGTPSTQGTDLGDAVSRSRDIPEIHAPVESVAGLQSGATEMLGETAAEHVKGARQVAKKKPFLTTLLLAMFVVGASLVFVIPRWEMPVEQGDITSAPGSELARPHDQRGSAEDLFLQGLASEDAAEQAKLFHAAANQGNVEAQHALGIMYSEGLGLPVNDSEAVKWLQRAAEQGHANAQAALGIMYAEGRGVPQDKVEAVKWYRKAAEQGDAAGQFRFGYSYAMGVGIARNLTEAVKWIAKAARQDHAQAQWALAMMYANGRGVRKDEDEAVKWFRKAAAQGDKLAQRELKKRGLDW